MFSQIANRLKSYRHHSKSVLQLREMDDRMLADIGVSRGEISHAVRNGRF